jgi:heat shock protein HtpX
MPVNPGYITWCDQCQWNINPRALTSRSERLWNRLNEWLGKRRNSVIFEEAKGDWSLDFRLTPGKLLVYPLAALWYVLVLWIAYRAYFLFFHLQSVGDLIAAFFFAALAFVLMPRVFRMKAPHLDRGQYPAIYEAADETASFLGAPPVDGIVIVRQFTAAYTVSGFRRKKLLIVGLPLFSSLTPEEKLAVLAHEMGHHAHRDITKSLFLGGVQRALGRLYHGLYPTTDYSELIAFLAKPLEWFRKGLAYGVLILWYAMGLAVWKDSQRAEYHADHASASVAGTPAAVSALRKMCYGPTFYKTLESVAQYGYTRNLFEEYRGRIRSVPPREVERIRVLTERIENSIDSSHPPTRYRLAYLEEKLPAAAPVLTDKLLSRMEAEFEALETIWEARMLTDYRSYLYDSY